MATKKTGLFLGPLLCLALLLAPTPMPLTPEAWRVLALASLMLVWWITEAVPLPVTALLPMVGLPLLGLRTMEKAAAPYASPIVFLFMGGFMIALAMERWGLHRRIALNIVRLTGTHANGIILGFLIASAAISMWISNTATAVMMLPIALSVIELLTSQAGQYHRQGVQYFAIAMMLAVAYGANIGGAATIIGTPPNVVFAGYIRQTFDYEVSFAKWMMVGVPFAAVMLMCTYWVLARWTYPNRLGRFAGAGELIQQELARLGKMSVAERRTLIIFLLTAACWIFRVQLNQLIPGLGLSDPIIAMLAAVALFVTPVRFRDFQFLLDWKDTERLPWGILLLFGGGLSLAAALEDAGLIALIGEQFAHLEEASFLIILGLAAVSLFLTEIMSNVALVTVLLPVVGGIAVAAEIRPLLVCVPVTLAASCAFMLPMSTPPNAIVFASGYLRVSHMARVGLILNLITVIVVAIMTKTVLPLVFEPIR
jgi:sodium-dependent dicarboxylate transporter 2/3/5